MFYVATESGFLTDATPTGTTGNVRFATSFYSWEAADNHGRASGFLWWTVLSTYA